MSVSYSLDIKILSKRNTKKIIQFLEKNNYNYMQEEGLFNFRKENNEKINPELEIALKIIEKDGGSITFDNGEYLLDISFHTSKTISIQPRVISYLDNPKNREFLKKLVDFIKKTEDVKEVKEYFDTQECHEIFKKEN